MPNFSENKRSKRNGKGDEKDVGKVRGGKTVLRLLSLLSIRQAVWALKSL